MATSTHPQAVVTAQSAYDTAVAQETNAGANVEARSARTETAPQRREVAVNGRRFSNDELKRAIAGSKTATTPLELIVENGSYFKTVRIDYHGGLRYPHFERVAPV